MAVTNSGPTLATPISRLRNWETAPAWTYPANLCNELSGKVILRCNTAKIFARPTLKVFFQNFLKPRFNIKTQSRPPYCKFNL